ncbi:Zn-ribbon domain-containing OB-fold protein [Streptomyces sp. BI20]|uniref:Zn-ribbon domain-containing OB-fold protein n=1 Tax=Streptomyces sp. BI20 TaxID=3403460 RepID=UPI003C756637
MVAGWFGEVPPEAGDGAGGSGGFRLIGSRCTACATVSFPPEPAFCRNPACAGEGERESVPLSPRGRIWSYTDGRYRPPAPYVSDPDTPWEPRTLVAVELAAEALVVLGQTPPGVRPADLAVGMEVEVVPGILDEDKEHGTTWTTWWFRPVPAEGDAGGPGVTA